MIDYEFGGWFFCCGLLKFQISVFPKTLICSAPCTVTWQPSSPLLLNPLVPAFGDPSRRTGRCKTADGFDLLRPGLGLRNQADSLTVGYPPWDFQRIGRDVNSVRAPRR